MIGRLPGLRHFGLSAALLGLAFGAGGFLLAWSGLYNVAASRDHWVVTRTFLEFGLRNSIETQSLGIRAPPLDGADLVRLGAGHFAIGCASCHGSPADAAVPIFRRMLPTPPPLQDSVRRWSDAELFWIVQNGLKYTGMPAWIAPRRDDEIWAVVAYLRRLPDLSADEYRRLANLDLAAADTDVPAVCVRCHGDAAAAPVSRLVPKLAGLSPAYIEFALRSYRAGTRASGIMQAAAGPLDDGAIRRIAAYYAALPRTRGTDGGQAATELGRRIAEDGLPTEGIPACLACHSGPRREIFPRLSGQHAPYIVNQLELWRKGLRRDIAPGQIMAPIARRLTPEQMHSVAAYLESLPVAGAAR